MTVVVGVSSGADISILADCRLSGTDPAGRVVVRHDICQKLAIPNRWSVVGFAGDLCLARDVHLGFIRRLQATPRGGADWLRDKEQALRFLRDGVGQHGRRRINADHRPCTRKPVELLTAWVDHGRTWIGEPWAIDDPESSPYMETLVLRWPAMEAVRRPMELQVIGSGAVISAAMRQRAYMKIAWYAHGTEHGSMHRAFFTAVVTRDLLEEAGDPMVGGLYQMASLSPRGPRVFPDFYWAPVVPGYGTYVAMRIEHGLWLQEHRPTGTVVRVMPPNRIQLRHPDWTGRRSKLFEPSLVLTPDSPGVIPERQGRTVYRLYDPDDVPDQVRESWGTPHSPPSDGRGSLHARKYVGHREAPR